jgi:hypothetical protein
MQPRSAGRVWIALWLGLSLWLLSSESRAEPVDPARSASARALFDEGVAHVDRDAWGPAAEAFRRALSLRDSQVIRYNLASALVELGKLVEASELLHVVQADAQADAALKQQAADKLAEVKPRIARIAIHAELAPGLSVDLDDAVLSVAQLDVPLTVDPGEHVVRARLDGALIDEQRAQLGAGESLTINLRPPPPPPEPLPAAAPAPVVTPAETARLALADPAPSAPARDEPPAPSRKKLWWGIAVGGVGVVAFVTLVALLVPQKRASSTMGGDFDPPSVGVRVPQ